MMLYPSWIEIPVNDLERAAAFYSRVFRIGSVSRHEYDEDGMPMRVVVLLASDKGGRAPGLSLVQSARHVPNENGVQINFHAGEHAMLDRIISEVTGAGGRIAKPAMNMGDGVRYAVLQDSEGNTIAVSAHQAEA